MSDTVTWRPHDTRGELTAAKRDDLPASAFAFSRLRKEPMTDASHVRNAIARFDQVTEATDEDRRHAFANIKKAARHYDVEMTAERWQDLGKP
jgi:hypothetical protein